MKRLLFFLWLLGLSGIAQAQKPTISGFAGSSATVCAGNVTTFTATIGNLTGSYAYTLTNGSSLISQTATSPAYSQTLVASGSGSQAFTLAISTNGQSVLAVTSLNVGNHPDYQPLVDFYSSTNGSGWFLKLGWLNGCDPCTGNNGRPWYGVSCTNGRVTRLSLEGNQLRGILPASLGSLTSLQQLYLNNNQLSGNIPSSWSTLTNIRQLYLSNNELSGCFPTSLSNLCGSGRTIVLSNNPNLPGGGNFADFCATGVGSDANLVAIATAIASQSAVCIGNPVSLSAFDAGNSLSAFYSWFAPSGAILQTPATSSVVSTTLTETGPKNFTVLISNSGSCTQVATISVKGIAQPTPTLTPFPNSTLICGQNSITLNATGNTIGEPYSYTFASIDGVLNISELSNITVNSPGTYSVTVGHPAGCIGTTTIQITTGDHPDYQALVDFYNSTNGAYWLSNTGWLRNCNPCTGNNGEPWTGLACREGRVTALMFRNNWLNGSLPASLSTLTKLQFINISKNQLRGSIPNSFNTLSELQYLNLEDNRLSGVIPSSLSALTSLRALMLSDNYISGGIPSSLGALKNLRHLHLYRNFLSGNIPSSLGTLTNLLYMNLHGNQLSGSIPNSFSTLINLEDLFLHNNFLSGIIPSGLGSLQKLRDLRLDNNQLSGSIPADLGKLNASVIALSENQLSGCLSLSLTNLCGLRWIYLDNNPGLPLNGDFRAFCANGTGSDAYLSTATATPVRPNLNNVVSLSASSSPGISFTWTAPQGAVLGNPNTTAAVSATLTEPGLQIFTVVSNGGTCVPPMTVSVVVGAPCGSPASSTGVGQPLTITGVRVIDCTNGSFQILTTGGNGQPINFGGIVGLRSDDPHNCLRMVDGPDLVRAINTPTSDIGPFQLRGVQDGGSATNTFPLDLKAFCTVTVPPSNTSSPPSSTTTTPATPTPTDCSSPTGTIGQPLQISGVTDVRCLTGSFRILTTGGNGQPVSFAGIVGLSNLFPYNCIRSLDGPDLLRAINTPTSDIGPFQLRGVQDGGIITPAFAFDFKGYCARLARIAQPEALETLDLTVLGNPSVSENITVEVRGAAGDWLQFQLIDEQGKLVNDLFIEKADNTERRQIRLNQAAGMYYLRATTPTQQKTVKLVRQ